MKNIPLPSPMKYFLSPFVIGATLFSLTVPAFADTDPSLPYRNYPGFQCNRWGKNGACMDFTYYGAGAATPAYVAAPAYAAAPVYVAPPVYYPPVRTYPTSSYYTNGYNNSYNNTYYSPYGYSYNDVTVRVSASRKDVQPGDTLMYTIYVRNNNNAPQPLDIQALLDPSITFLSASNAGYLFSSDEVHWPTRTVAAGASVTMTLRVQVNGRYGDTIRLRVRANGDEDVSTVSVTDPYSSTYYNYNDPYYNNYNRNANNYNYNGCDPYSTARPRTVYDTCYNYGSGYNYNSGRITTTVTDSPDPVQTGDFLVYTITLRNNDNVGRTVDARAIMDTATTFFSSDMYAPYSSSYNGYNNSVQPIRSGDEVRWASLFLNPNESRTITLRVRVNTAARNSTLQLRVIVDGVQTTETTTVRDNYYYRY